MSIVYANGTVDVTVPQGQKIAIASFGAETQIQYQVSDSNQPPIFYNASVVNDEQVILGTFSQDQVVRINAGPLNVFYAVAVSPVITENVTGAIIAPAGEQGSDLSITGGTSSTSANAGGAVSIVGGVPGATGVGGAVSVRGGAGSTGSTTVAGTVGGAATFGGGAGGAKTGTGAAAGGAGGATTLTSGAGGNTASSGSDAGGAAGALNITGANGGNATAGTGNGGKGASITLTAGTGGTSAGGTAGVNGVILHRSAFSRKQGAPTAKTTSATLTAAEILTGIITVNQGAAGTSAQQLPLASAMDTALPDFAADDSFDVSIINISTTDAEDASVTTNTGWTLVGNMDFPAYSAAGSLNSSGILRLRKTGTAAWVAYRIG